MDDRDIHRAFLSPENFEALLGTVDNKYRQMSGGAGVPASYRTLGVHLLRQVLRSAPVYRPGNHTPVEYLKMLNRRVLELFMKNLSSDLRGGAGAQRALQRDQMIPPRKVAHFETLANDPRAGLYRKADETNDLERRLEETVRARSGPRKPLGNGPLRDWNQGMSAAPARPHELEAQEVPAEDVDEIMRRFEEMSAERVQTMAAPAPSGRASDLHDEVLDAVVSQGAAKDSADTDASDEIAFALDEDSWEAAFHAMRKEEIARSGAAAVAPAPSPPGGASVSLTPADRKLLEGAVKALASLSDVMIESAKSQAEKDENGARRPGLGPMPVPVPVPRSRSLPKDVVTLESFQRNPGECPDAWDLSVRFPAGWRSGSARMLFGWIPKTSFTQVIALVRVEMGDRSVLCELVPSMDASFPYLRVQPIQEVPEIPLTEATGAPPSRIAIRMTDGEHLPALQDVFEIDAMSRNTGDKADQWVVRTKMPVPSQTLAKTTQVRIWGNFAEPALPLHGAVSVVRTQAPSEIVIRLPTPGDTNYDVKRAGSLILGNRSVQWVFEKIDAPSESESLSSSSKH